MNTKTGIELIAQERQEQITKHGYITTWDVNENNDYQLCDAASGLVFSPKYERVDLVTEDFFKPKGWSSESWQKLQAKPYKERLIIAGALIAAEIDRLNSLTPES